jgi:chemotaxis signal transduction protein
MSAALSNPSALSVAGRVPGTLASSSKTKVAALKCILFKVGKLTLGLSMQSVSKVVNMPKVYSSGLYPIGITSVGNLELTIIDLHQRLFQTPLKLESSQKGYLILMTTPSRDWLGIPVAETPALQEIPLPQIRVLPESYRRSDTLSIASHMAKIVEADGEEKMAFLLDVECLVSAMI